MVGIEVFVFDGNRRIFDIRRERVKFNGSAILLGVDFVEQGATAIQDFGANWIACGLAQLGRRGEVAKEDEEANKDYSKKERNKDELLFAKVKCD